jgi:hypothetical protein
LSIQLIGHKKISSRLREGCAQDLLNKIINIIVTSLFCAASTNLIDWLNIADKEQNCPQEQ